MTPDPLPPAVERLTEVPIRQTTFGRLFCWLGVHQIVTGQVDRGDFSFSLYGGCVRCDRACAWDAS